MEEEGEGPPSQDVCSVCHGNFQIPCQANCSHWFCGNCILMVWEHTSGGLQPCKCPLCRRPITLLVPTDDHHPRHDDPQVSNILSKIHTYNRFFGAGSPGYIQRLLDLPFLLRRLFRDFMDPHRSLPLVLRARVYITMILSAIYIVSPIDIIPEGFVGIIGLLDDLLIALIFFLHIAALYRSVLYFRHGGSSS